MLVGPITFWLSPPNPLEMSCATVSLKILKAEDAMFSLRRLITCSRLEALYGLQKAFQIQVSPTAHKRLLK